MSVVKTCGCGIDVHAYVVPASFPACITAAVPADWPLMAEAKPCHDRTPGARGASAIADEAIRRMALRDNARRFLQIADPVSP